MDKFIRIIKKYKYVLMLNLILIVIIILFPMKESHTEFLSGTERVGIILEQNVVVSQKFIAKTNDIERISLLMATIDKNDNCNINISLYDENDVMIGSKIVSNRRLKKVAENDTVSTDLVDYYLEKPISNAKGKGFYVRLFTDCNGIIRLHYYDTTDGDERAFYNGEMTIKRMPILYTGTKYSNCNLLYPIALFSISLIIVLGGKNEKK